MHLCSHGRNLIDLCGSQFVWMERDTLLDELGDSSLDVCSRLGLSFLLGHQYLSVQSSVSLRYCFGCNNYLLDPVFLQRRGSIHGIVSLDSADPSVDLAALVVQQSFQATFDVRRQPEFQAWVETGFALSLSIKLSIQPKRRRLPALKLIDCPSGFLGIEMKTVELNPPRFVD